MLDGDVVFAVEAADGKTFGESAKEARQCRFLDLGSLLEDPAKLSGLLKEQGAFSMSVRLSGDALVDLRSVDGKIFARANVKQILTLAGEDATRSTSNWPICRRPWHRWPRRPRANGSRSIWPRPQPR